MWLLYDYCILIAKCIAHLNYSIKASIDARDNICFVTSFFISLSNVKNTNSSVSFFSFKNSRAYPDNIILDKTRAVTVLNNFKNDPLLIVFAFCSCSI